MNYVSKNSISACLVVFNEEALIERCLESIKPLVDEIIIVHDGDCLDKTLEIAKKYTDKIFIRPHIGIAEPHRSFTYGAASSEWIFQIDADEFIDKNDIEAIRGLLVSEEADGYNFKWEFWDGKKPIRFDGLQKLCLFKKNKIRNLGIPQRGVEVKGLVKKAGILLRHRPIYENISWAIANKKRKYWLKSHVKYYFPELVEFECFNTSADDWISYTKKVRSHPLVYLAGYPLKNLIGQLKNGLWKTLPGISVAFQQYVYYLELYWQIWKMDKKLKQGQIKKYD